MDESICRADKVDEGIRAIIETAEKLGLNLFELSRAGKCVSVAAETQIMSNIAKTEEEREKVIELLRQGV